MRELLLMLPDAFLFCALCLLVLIAAFVRCRRVLVFSSLCAVIGYLFCVSYQSNHLLEIRTGLSSHLLSFFNPDNASLGMKYFAGYAALAILVLFEAIGFKKTDAFKAMQKKEGLLLILFALLGASLMCGSSHFLMSYLGLELLSLSLVVLIAWGGETPQLEAAVKYFLLSALASGILLFGVSLIYGATGHLNFVSSALVRIPFHSMYILGQVLLVAGVAFKFGWVPFHFWVSDVYASARWYTLIAIGSLSKIGVLGLVFRLLEAGVIATSPAPAWAAQLVIILSIFSILFGNILAVQQKDLRRLLAYSSIANMGFLGLALISQSGAPFYLAVYVLNSLAIATILFHHFGQNLSVELTHLKGFALRYPYQGALLAFAFLSMAGIPITPGFWAKWHVLKVFFAQSSVFFAAFIVVATLIGTFYYLRMVKYLYEEAEVSTTVQHPSEVTLFPSVSAPTEKNSLLLSDVSVNPLFFFLASASLLWVAVFPNAFLEWSRKITGVPTVSSMTIEQAAAIPPITSAPAYSARVLSAKRIYPETVPSAQPPSGKIEFFVPRMPVSNGK